MCRYYAHLRMPHLLVSLPLSTTPFPPRHLTPFHHPVTSPLPTPPLDPLFPLKPYKERKQTNTPSPFPLPPFTDTCKHTTLSFAAFCGPSWPIQNPCGVVHDIWQTLTVDELCDGCKGVI